MRFYKIILAILVIGVFSGCAVFQSQRQNIIPKQKSLNSEQIEVIQEDAKVLQDIAQYIKDYGIKPNDERSIILLDGTKVMVKYVGNPYQDVNGLDNKQAHRINEKAKDIVDDYARDRAEFADQLDEAREKQITEVNTFWDWKKILGGGILTWVVVIVAVPVLGAIFPVLIPIFSLIFQGLKLGISSFATVAKFGLTGTVNLVKAIESFRDKHKGTDIGKAFDEHMHSTLHTNEKQNLDALKNKFDI